MDFFSENNAPIQYNKIATEAISDFRSDYGKVNIIIAGRTGVGKSTLINAIFKKEELARTATGKPVTQEIQKFSVEGFPISIIDTKGLEILDYAIILRDLENYIDKQQRNEDPHEQIHVAWVCIAEGSSRIEQAEIELVNLLIKKNIPVIIVLTKLFSRSEKLQKAIEEQCPRAKAVIRVQSIPLEIDEDYTMKPKNLKKLAELTNGVLPEAMGNAFVSAQKVSLDMKKEKSSLIIIIAKKEAMYTKNDTEFIVAGVKMITRILGIFGFELDDMFVIEISIIIFGDKKSKFKKLVNKFLKFVPGVKTKLKPEQKAEIMERIGDMFVDALLEAHREKRNGEKPTENEIKYLLIDVYERSFE